MFHNMFYSLREKLRREWVERQEQIKQEFITIAYCYWDGKGTRREMRVQKGTTIDHFLRVALELLRNVCLMVSWSLKP